MFTFYGHRAISLMGFYNRPVQSLRQTLQRLYVDRADIVLSSHQCIEISWISQGARAASVRRPFGDCTVAV